MTRNRDAHCCAGFRVRWIGAFPLVMLLVALCACNLQRTIPAGDLLDSDPSVTISEDTPVEPEVPDGWTVVAPGIMTRRMTQALPDGRTPDAQIVRVDPLRASLRVHYSPGDPGFIGEWGDRLPGAVAIVNGGFFDPDDQALGLVVSDGRISGVSFQGFGGMLQVDTNGTVYVRSLVMEPYLGETLVQAVQGFPMLVESPGMITPRGDGFDERSFRTVAAQDTNGSVILAVFHDFISLKDVQDWLLASDLDIRAAFGLDGGRSSALLVRGADSIEMLSFDALPAVIAVYPR